MIKTIIIFNLFIFSLQAFDASNLIKKESLNSKDLLLLEDKAINDKAVAEALGNLYKDGRKLSKNHKKALHYFKLSKPSDKVFIAIADIYFRSGNNIPKDLDKAKIYYQKAAELSSIGKFRYALAIEQKLEDNKPDFKKSFNLYKGGSSDYAPCAFKTGLAYQFGRGVKLNTSEAIRYHKLAIDLDNYPPSYNELGNLYYYGINTKRDTHLAISYLNEAAKRNCQAAQRSLIVVSYQNSDFNQAYFWFVVCKSLNQNIKPNILKFREKVIVKVPSSVQLKIEKKAEMIALELKEKNKY